MSEFTCRCGAMMEMKNGQLICPDCGSQIPRLMDGKGKRELMHEENCFGYEKEMEQGDDDGS